MLTASPLAMWFLWALILLVVLTVVFGAIGRSLQRKGRALERNRETDD